MLHIAREGARGARGTDAEADRRTAGRRRPHGGRDRIALRHEPARRLAAPARPARARPRPGARGRAAPRVLARPRSAGRARRLAGPLPLVLDESPRRPRHRDPQAPQGDTVSDSLGTMRRDARGLVIRLERTYAAAPEDGTRHARSSSRGARAT